MTESHPPPPRDVANGVETLSCYSNLYVTRAHVYAPRDRDELRRVLAYASEAGRRVTFRAGGHAFDDQSLGDDVVVTLVKMDSIEVLADPRVPRLRVGPGATWGAILAALQPHGLVPAVTVTTQHATAGGTLSGDCLSRFSPAYGKEGTWIESFDLMTLDGRVLTCRPPRDGVPPQDQTLEERAFTGVIGGLGYLGAVVSITYRVLDVGETDGRIGVRSRVRKFTTYRDLAKDLIPIVRKTEEEESDPRDESKHDSIYSALSQGLHGEPEALLVTSSFTTDPDRRPMPVNEPDLAIRPFAEILMRNEWISRHAWPLFFKYLYKDGETYIDDLEGFTFFMDGNVRARDLAATFGVRLKTVQQTFIVPSGPGSRGGWDAAEDDLVEWLEHASATFTSRGLYPALHDVLYLPADARFSLSATADLAGFAVSYAFETNDETKLEKARATFSDLADVLWEKFRGRVYLVKNVCAKAETLRAMYGAALPAFFALKRELDPTFVLRNAFLERNFPEFADPIASRTG